MIINNNRRLMTKRFILNLDEQRELKLKVLALNLSVSAAEAVRRLIDLGYIEILGSVESSTGKITWNKEGVKLVLEDDTCITIEEAAKRR